MAELTEQQQQLLTVKGFIRRYLQIYWQEELNQRQAYERTEQEYLEIVGRRKYASFESFRPTMYRHLRDNNG